MAQKIIGLDLGTHEVKVVTLEGGFRGFTVMNYRSAPVPMDPPDQEERPLADRLLDALQMLVEDDPNLFRADIVNTVVPGSLMSSHVLTLPFTDHRKIEQTLPFQLEDQIPFDIDDVVFDYQVLAQNEGKTEILVGVVRKSTMATLLEMLEKVGVDPRVVSLAALAYQNLFAHGVLSPLAAPTGALSTSPAGNGSEPTEGASEATSSEPAWAKEEESPAASQLSAASVAEAILDVGHLSTDMCILERGATRYARSFPVAGNGLSIAIAAAERIPLAEAELLKHEAVDLVEAGDERSKRMAGALARGISPLVRGLRQSFFAFKSRTRHEIRRVYLTGGTARLPGLDRHLAKELGCEVLPLDPFPDHMEKGLPEGQRDDPAAALAMALALRGQGGARTARVNLRKGEFTYKGDLSRLKGIVPRLAILAALVLVLLVANVFVRFQALSIEEALVDEQLCELTERVLGACTTIPDDAISSLRGQRAAASIVPQVSAAEILSEVVRRLSRVDEIELRELDIGGSRVRLQGEADSFDAVARVVSSLRDYECFSEVAQGQTRQARQSQKIEFNVDAVLAAQCES